MIYWKETGGNRTYRHFFSSRQRSTLWFPPSGMQSDNLLLCLHQPSDQTQSLKGSSTCTTSALLPVIITLAPPPHEFSIKHQRWDITEGAWPELECQATMKQKSSGVRFRAAPDLDRGPLTGPDLIHGRARESVSSAFRSGSHQIAVPWRRGSVPLQSI